MIKIFITLVVKIDKICRDLSELKMKSEIQNTTVLSKLEQKLPFLVKRDWIKRVSDENYDAKPLKEMFDKFAWQLSFCSFGNFKISEMKHFCNEILGIFGLLLVPKFCQTHF